MELRIATWIIFTGLMVIFGVRWILALRTMNRKQRQISILNTIGAVSLIVGVAVSIGPNPTVRYTGSRGSGLRFSGPPWPGRFGLLIFLLALWGTRRIKSK